MMVDLGDVENLERTPSPRLEKCISLGENTLNIAGDAKVVNAAADGIRIHRQTVEIAEAAKEVNMDNRSTRLTNTGVENSTNIPINIFNSVCYPRSTPYSKDDSAAFTYGLMGHNQSPWALASGVWNEVHENFSDPREVHRQMEEIYILWHDDEITNAIHSVETAGIEFLKRYSLEGRVLETRSWARVKDDIDEVGSQARKYYKSGDLLQDQMVDSIRNINSFLAHDNDLQFLDWLDRLPLDSHRLSLAVRYILVAVVHGYPFDRSTIRYLEEILSLFSKSTVYIRLCRERRPTPDMPAATVEIFTQTAKLLHLLLDASKPHGHRSSKQIKSAIKRLQNTLADVNQSAGVKVRGGGRRNFPVRDERYPILQLAASILDLCRDVPVHYEPRATAYPTRQKSRKDGLNSDLKQLDTREIVCKEQVLDALCFRGREIRKDINECLRYAEISGSEKARLAAMTRDDRFQSWLKEDRRSSALVIHGNLESDDANCPISYLAAQIGKTYLRRKGFIVLSWFCGLHVDENEAALMACLTGQLISQATLLLPPEDFEFVSRNEYKRLKQQNFEALISVFLNTIRALLSKRIVVFCLIDSISTYETGKPGKVTRRLISFFHDLVKSSHRRSKEGAKPALIFKLLISDGQNSELASELFRYKEILELDEDADTDVDSDASLISSD